MAPVKFIFVHFCFLFAALLFSSVDVAAQEVVLTTSDGYVIYGDLSRPAGKDLKIGVVLLHMYRNNKESWESLAAVLLDKGITSLALDMRGHGKSKIGPAGNNIENRVIARDPTLFNAMYLDSMAGVQFLTEKLGLKSNSIALLGASVGCSVAIHTIVQNNNAAGAVVLLTPGENYLGVPTREHITNWPGYPMLILSSEEEQRRGARTIFNKLRHRSAELVLFDEEDIHGTNMFGEVNGVEEKIAEWIVEKLKN